MTLLLNKQRRVPSNARRSDKDTADQMISPIAMLASMIARPAPHIERDQQLPAELKFALRAAGIYGTLVPWRHGDLELGAPSALRAFAALAVAERPLIAARQRIPRRRVDWPNMRDDRRRSVHRRHGRTRLNSESVDTRRQWASP